MSVEASKWAYSLLLSPIPKSVLLALAWHQNKETKLCYPGISLLVDDTGLSARSIKRGIQALEEFGYISRYKGRGNRNEYTLHQAVTSVRESLVTESPQGVTESPQVVPESHPTISNNKELISKPHAATKRGSSAMKKPTVEEVQEYLKLKDITTVNAEAFVDYYESTGWMMGKNKIKSWEACVRTWRNRNQQHAPETTGELID